MAKRLYTYDDIMNLPDFIRVELINGVIHTDDWTNLEVMRKSFRIHHLKIITSLIAFPS